MQKLARIEFEWGEVAEYVIAPDEEGTPCIWRMPSGRWESYAMPWHIETFRRRWEGEKGVKVTWYMEIPAMAR